MGFLGAIFFLQTRIAIPRYFSQSYGAYFKYIVHVHTRTVNVCAMLMISYVILKYAPYDWLKYRGMAILVCRKKNHFLGTFEKQCVTERSAQVK